jgi:DNA-binding protein Fis
MAQDETGHRPLTLDEVHYLQVRFVMEHCKGNKTQASKLLQVDRRTLYRTLQRMEGRRRPVGAGNAAL